MKLANIVLAVLAISMASGMSGADWLTFGGDPARSGWAREEKTLTPENVKSLTLLWKTKLDNTTREMTGLTAPVVAERIFGPAGVKDFVVVGGSADKLYAIDAESGKILWQKTFQASVAPKQAGHWLCPNALNDTPVIEKERGFGHQTIHVISADGKLHSLNIINGEDRQPPVQFVPPYSKNWSLNVMDGVVYTALSQGCGGGRSGVYALDLSNREAPVKYFYSKNGGIWGRAGVAISPAGVVYAETGDGKWDPAQGSYSDSFLALSAKELKLLDFYTPTNRARITEKDLDMGNITPVVFPFKGRDVIAGAGKEGRIFLLEAKSLGGADHRTPAWRSPLYTNEEVNLAGRGFWGSFATWEDPRGVRWLFAPAWGPVHPTAPKFEKTNGPATHGSIMAFRVEEQGGKLQLGSAWMSRDMDVPEPPVVANGIVFAVSSGENGAQFDPNGTLMNSQQRIARADGNAILYAFDAATGQELFSSKDTISGITHFSGIAVSGGRVFVTGVDNTVYTFGLPQ